MLYVLTDSHLGDVNLADHMFSRLNIFTRFGDDDALSLAACVWLTDVCLVFFGSGVSLKVAGTVKYR